MERLRDLTTAIERATPAKIFARAALAMIRGAGRIAGAKQFARERAHGEWADTPYIDRAVEAAAMIRMAAVPGIESDLSAAERTLWADPSIAYIEDVRAASVVGRIAGAVHISFHKSSIENATAVGAGWVREGRAIPVRRSLYSTIAPIVSKKVAGLIVASSEIATTPTAERNVGAELRRACAEQLDITFCGDGAGDTATPAGILASAYPIATSGSTVAAICTDLAAMVAAQITTAAGQPTGSVWVIPPATWAHYRLSKIADAEGTLAGLPVIVSSACAKVTLLAASYLVIAGGDMVRLMVSAGGLIEMDDAPTGVTVGTPTALSATPISLFQEDAIALRASIPISWTVAGPQTSDGRAAVVVLEP